MIDFHPTHGHERSGPQLTGFSCHSQYLFSLKFDIKDRYKVNVFFFAFSSSLINAVVGGILQRGLSGGDAGSLFTVVKREMCKTVVELMVHNNDFFKLCNVTTY